MHTPNQGLTYTFKFSAVLIICSLYECSLPSVPFPLFPSRFPFPRSLPEAISGVCDSHESPPLQIYAFPSLLLLPLFPALFPYWRLCPCPLSLLMIMFPPSFPIFDYAPFSSPYFWLCPDTLCPWCPYVTFARLLEMQFLCSKCLSERTGQLLFVHKTIF